MAGVGCLCVSRKEWKEFQKFASSVVNEEKVRVKKEEEVGCNTATE